MPRLRLTVLAAAATAAALLACRPDLSDPAGWAGDQAALTAAWAIALGCCAYLAVVASVCLFALRSQRVSLARRAAGYAPQFVRRLVEVALVSALTVAPAVPAFAAARRAATADQSVVRQTRDVPVVRSVPRAPETTVQPSPPARPAATTAPSPAPTVPEPAGTRPLPRPTSPAAPTRAAAPSRPQPAPRVAPTAREQTHVVRSGDNLWVVARAELQRRGTAHPDDAAIARYLAQVIAANVASLRSGDPNLIFPGEVVALPEPG